MGGKPDPREYQEKSAQLVEFKRLEEQGQLNLYYLDETGFCLIPSVPYGWQNIGECLTIKSRRSSRLNVLGILKRNNHLEAYISEQTINSDSEAVAAERSEHPRASVVIACIDTFFAVIDKPTVIVLDSVFYSYK